MLTSIQLYLKDPLLNGLQSPFLDPLEAVVQPPVLSDVADHPYAFIWAGAGMETRQTAPRSIRQPNGVIAPGGYQKMIWKIAVRLYTVMSQEDPNVELAFPALVDATLQQLNTTQIPIIITDPGSGQQSQILTIAENVEMQYASALVTSGPGQGIVRFACDLIIDVEEKVAWSEGVA